MRCIMDELPSFQNPGPQPLTPSSLSGSLSSSKPSVPHHQAHLGANPGTVPLCFAATIFSLLIHCVESLFLFLLFRELPEYIATARSVLGDNVFVETMAAMAMGVGIGVDHPLTKPRAEAKPKAREGEMDLKALWGQLSGGRAKSGGTIATPTTTTSTGAGANRVKSTPSPVTVPMGNATDAKGRPGVPPAAASTATPTTANEEEEKEKEEKEEEEEVEGDTASATTAAPAVPKKLKKVQSLTPLAIPTPATPAAMTEGTTGTAPSPGASDQSFISDTPTTPSQTSSTATPSHHQPSNYFFVSPIAPPPPSREAVAALEEFSESTRQRMESFGFSALDSNEDGPSPFR